MNVYGKRVILRAMEKSDCEMMRQMFNDPEISDLVIGWAFPISQFAQEKWFDVHYNDHSSLHFIIETKEDGPVGAISLSDIDWKNRRASHGIKLKSGSVRTKGIGTDAVMALMRYAFDELGLHRIDSSRFASNIASARLYEKCGWVIEGTRREHVFKSGQFRDVILIGILAAEYYALIERNHYWEDDHIMITDSI